MTSFKTQLQRNKGFTLVELLVSISIFVLITGLVLVNYQGFNSGVLLTSFAYDIALTVREAQSYGINVTEQGVGTWKFDYPYGVHFVTAQPYQYVFFSDSIGDSIYTSSSELLKTYVSKRGNKITALCAGPDAGHCFSKTNLDVVYRRPSPQAIITSCIILPATCNTYPYAKVTIQAADGKSYKYVVVSWTGQISVE